MMQKFVYVLKVTLVSIVMVGCHDAKDTIFRVSGTIDSLFVMDKAPQKVYEAIINCDSDHCERILHDETNGISVWSLVWCGADISSEGYGIVVQRNHVSTQLPDIYHGKNPMARYDTSTGNLWLVCGAMEGTGLQTEQLFLLRFNADGKAYIVATVNPYDVQQALCQQLGYSISGQQITFYDGKHEICKATNTVTDMNGFDSEQPVWIGEQLQFDISGETPRLLVTPGLKFTTGLVLTYDAMPTFAADINLDSKGQFSIDKLKTLAHPFEGIYLDEDNNDPNLLINYRRNDGKYDVYMSIFRLTTLDDGIGMVGDNALHFTATDACDNPIKGEITLKEDTAEVVFTHSTWPLIENGSKFRYSRQK